MTTYDELISDICNDERYKSYCYKLTSGNQGNDLYQEFVLRFLSQPKEKILNVYESGKPAIDYYCVKIIKSLFLNKNLPFRKYMTASYEFKETIQPNEQEYDHSIDCVANEIQKQNNFITESYDKMLSRVFFLYLKLGSYRKVSDALSTPSLKISHTTVKKFCDEYKAYIKENVSLCHC